jgi:hypothetical protein
LSSVLSFIANIARKRPELNRDKTTYATPSRDPDDIEKAIDALENGTAPKPH